jgi:hypothetical protein
MADEQHNLFNHIPGNLFSVLAGPLKEVHAGLLMIIYGQYRKTIYTLNKDMVIDLLCEYLESLDEGALLDLEEDEEYRELSRSVRERANHMLRKLTEAGWLVQEQYYDYSFKITIPDYALALLEVFHKTCSGYRMEFKGRVLSIYQNLTGEDGLSYIALHQSAEDTQELIDGLKRLNHSIKRYTEKLMEAADARSILAQIFDEYHNKILGEQYFRLKTSEHVSKYRIRILAKVREWQSNRTEIMHQAKIMVTEKQTENPVQGENQIYDWLGFIESSFLQMDEILEEIDRRNAQYARAAVERLRFQLQQGKGMEQKLAVILSYLARKVQVLGEKGETPAEVINSIGLFPQRVVDENSAKLPPRKSSPHTPRVQETREVDPGTREKKLAKFRRRVKEEITVQQINDYVGEMMDEGRSLPLAELPLQTREQWVKLIYIILYSNSKRAEYTLIGPKRVQVPLEEGAIEVPGLIVKRKEGSR